MLDSNILFAIPGIIVSFTIYGYAQAKAATMLGDPTPRAEGRLTLNPIPHIEPWGLIVMCFASFGWGRSMPINIRNFADPGKGLMVVSLVGLGANLLAAFLATLIMFILIKIGMITDWVFIMLRLIAWYNVMFAVLNMIPIPPLDGSRVLAYFLPPRLAYQYQSYSQYGFIILIMLIFFLNFGALIRPIIGAILGGMQWILSLFF